MGPFEAEALRTVRARRRLVEFELIERKVLLAVTVALVLLTVVVAFVGGPLQLALSALMSTASGGALLAKSRAGRDPR
jgi:fucose permease